MRAIAYFCNYRAVRIDATFCSKMVMGRLLDVVTPTDAVEKSFIFVPKNILFGQLSLLIVEAFHPCSSIEL